MEHHIDCLNSGSAEYYLEINGGHGIRKVSLAEGIETDKFDIITLQQASYLSGKPQSYFPYLKMLIALSIQKLRDTVPEFDYGNGGISLCRDGFHLTLDYGRLAAACTWLRFILKKPINLNEFGDFDSKLTDKIMRVIEETTCNENF